jgi:hypothetical protein
VNNFNAPQYSKDGNLTFTFDVNDPLAGVDSSKVKCYLKNEETSATTPEQDCASETATFTNQPEGVYKLYVKAADLANNNTASDVPSPQSIVDRTAPKAAITSNVTNPTKSSTVTFNFPITDLRANGIDPGSGTDSSTISCRLRRGGTTIAGPIPCSNTISYNFLITGTYTFELTGSDRAGNALDSATSSYTWKIDQASPVLSLDSFSSNPLFNNPGFPDFTHNQTLTLTFNAKDASGLQPPGCWVNGPLGRMLAAQCSVDPVSWKGSALFKNLPEGKYTFTAAVTDTVGNALSLDISNQFTIDATRPTVAINAPFPPDLSTGSVDVTFSGNDIGAGLASYTCTLTQTGKTAIKDFDCNSKKQYNNLDEGEYTFSVVSVDKAGNISAPSTKVWFVDKSAPETFVYNSNDPADTKTFTDTVYSSVSVVTFYFDYGPVADFDHFECKVDNGTYQPCGSASTKQFTFNLPEGPHTFYVRAVDRAGNKDQSPAGFYILIDPGKPVVTINGFPPAQDRNRSAAFSFIGIDKWTKQSNLRYECRVDNFSWKTCTPPTVSTDSLFDPPVTFLLDGFHTFYVRAKDETNNVSDIALYVWEVDTLPPTVQITNPPPTVTKQRTISITFSGYDNNNPSLTENLTYECNLDNTAWVACSSPASYSQVADGNHSFMVRARDRAGNETASPVLFSWKVDNVAPSASITAPADQDFVGWIVALSFSGVDNPGVPPSVMTPGPLKFECSVDGGAWVECRGLNPAPTGTYQYSSLPEGLHAFKVRAIDEVGNIGAESAPRTLKVDLTGPSVTIDQALPASPTQSTSALFSFSGSDTSQTAGLASGLAGFQCQLSRTGPGGSQVLSAWTACNSGTQAYTDSVGISTTEDADYTFEVRAVDKVSNVSAPPKTYTWRVDHNKPVVQILKPNTAAISSTTVIFEFTGSDGPFGSGINPASYSCQLDTGPWSACTSGQTYDISPTQSLTHTLVVSATDNVGLRSDLQSVTFSVDMTVPDTQLLNQAGLPALTNQRSITFDFAGTDTPSAADLRFDCSLNGAFEPCNGPTSSSKHYDNLPDGTYVFQVRAVDKANNADLTPATHTWRIDGTEPNSGLLTHPKEVTNVVTATFTFSADDGAQGTGVKTIECRLDGAAWSLCSSTLTFTGLADGQHTFEVRATDETGNVEQSPASFTWVLDTVPPDTQITSGPAALSAERDAKFTFEGQDGAGSGVDIFECSLDGALFTTCPSGRTFSGLTDGKHTFRVRSRDKALNLDLTPAVYEWEVKGNKPPEFKTFLPLVKRP